MTLRQTVPLQLRKILKKSFGRLVGSCIVVLIISAGLYAFMSARIGKGATFLAVMMDQPHVWAIWFALGSIIICHSFAYELLYFLMYFYDMDDQKITIRKGVIAKTEINLPFSRITDVYVDQDVLDFFLGIYDVHIATPTAESASFAHIDGVNKLGSMKLKKLILEQIKKSQTASPTVNENRDKEK